MSADLALVAAVRNRSKELGELLSDLDRVRQERRKAKANRNKYTGVGNDGSGGGGPSFTSTAGSRYGGFGSDSFYEGGSSSGKGGGGGGGGHSSGFQDSASRGDEFEEYDAGDDDAGPSRAAAAPRRSAAPSRSSQPSRTASKPTPPPPAAKVAEVNLFDFDDDEPTPARAPVPNLNQALPAAPVEDFDDDGFDDFQSAAPVASAPAPVQQQARPAQNVFDLLNQAPKPAATPSYQQPRQQQQPAMGGFAPMQVSRPQVSNTSSFASASSAPTPAAQQPKPAADFSDLFALAAPTVKSSVPAGGAGGQKLSMQQMASQHRQESLFKPAAQGSAAGSGWDSLL